MTKDLALSVHGDAMKREHWLTTTAYMDAVETALIAKLAQSKL